MALPERIDLDLKVAMKEGRIESVSTLRMVRSALKNKQIELGRELADDDVVAVLQRELKQRREAADQYRTGRRVELADKEEQEAKLLANYLPTQLSDDELGQLVDEAIRQTGASGKADMGRVIIQVMAGAKGQVEGSRVAATVAKRLG